MNNKCLIHESIHDSMNGNLLSLNIQVCLYNNRPNLEFLNFLNYINTQRFSYSIINSSLSYQSE